MKEMLDTLKKGAAYLERHGVESPRMNMELLTAHVLGCRRIDLYVMFERPLGEDVLEPLRELTKRRAAGEPIQHLIGTVEFLNQEFYTDARALIPRPETEELAARLIRLEKEPPPARILDMGCGSGVLGLSLAAAFPESSLVLADLSPDALALAQKNAGKLFPGTNRVSCVESDLFSNVEGTFDWIVANLPYIPSGELEGLSREVQRDPALALDGGPDGLRIIERFLSHSATYANPGALLALEVGLGQTSRTAEIAAGYGWQTPVCHLDLSGADRFVTARFLS